MENRNLFLAPVTMDHRLGLQCEPDKSVRYYEGDTVKECVDEVSAIRAAVERVARIARTAKPILTFSKEDVLAIRPMKGGYVHTRIYFPSMRP